MEMTFAQKMAAKAAEALKNGQLDGADFEGSGDFTYEPPVEGLTLARLVGVVDLGVHPQRAVQGQEKPPCAEVMFEFELLGKKHRKEIEVAEEDGTKTTKVIYPILRETLPVKGGPRANFIKLLEALRAGRKEIKHPMLMIGEAFILNIIHSDNGKEGKEKRVYANIRDGSGTWKVSAPVRMNEEGEPEPIKAPEPTVELRAFMWDLADKESWDSLYIAGERTKTVDGKEVKETKNWIQEKIKSALNFEDSPIKALLDDLHGDLPVPSTDPEDDLGGTGTDEVLDDASETDSGSEGDEDDPLAGLSL